MEANYVGPATFVHGDQRVSVEAVMQSKAQEWYGTVAVSGTDDAGVLWDAFNAPGSMAVLELPSGRQGDVLVRQPGADGAVVTGSGPAPF